MAGPIRGVVIALMMIPLTVLADGVPARDTIRPHVATDAVNDPAADQDAIDRVLALSDALRINDIAQVLHREGRAYGVDLNRDMLDGRGGVYWSELVDDIYSAKRLADTVSIAMLNGLSPAQIEDSLTFFQTEAGKNTISLEISARIALSDPNMEADARSYYHRLKGSDDARFDLISQYIVVNDLLEQNVAGALSFSYYLYRGLVDGGALEMDEDSIRAEVWRDEPETRADTESWLFGFLLMAYQPLSDQDIQANLAFSLSEAGQALNLALNDGFEMAYRDISYGLGLGLAGAMAARDL